MPAGTESRRRHTFVYAALILCSAVTIGPFIWMFLTSIKTYEETIKIPVQVFPAAPQFVNYSIVFGKLPFFRLYWNTLIVTVFSIVGQLLVVSLAAYAFARLRFPGKNALFLMMLALMMIPGQVFIIPRYRLFVSLGITNTIPALFIPQFFSVFGVFLMRQFFQTLPKELDEAAIVDGAGYFRIYWHIMIPLSTAGLVSLAIVTMLSAWKELMWPIIVNRSMDRMTLSAGLSMLIGEHTTYYEQVMAGATISVMPMIVMFIFFQKQFVTGIAKTGIKA